MNNIQRLGLNMIIGLMMAVVWSFISRRLDAFMMQVTVAEIVFIGCALMTWQERKT